MKKRPLAIVICFSLAYVVWFSWFTIARHHKLNSSRFDLGNVEQTIWSTTQGSLLHMTNPYGTDSATRPAFHGDFFLLALVPLYAAWPQAETLLILQTLALASGALAIWLIARRVLLHGWLATLLAGVYLLNPALQWTNIFDVHAVAFAGPLILWAGWAALTRRYVWTFILVFLAATTKEEVGLMVAAIGIYVLWRQRQRKWGIVLTVVPILWSLIVTLVTIPTWQKYLATPPPVYQSVLGDSGAVIVKNTLLHPARLVTALTSRVGLTYLWQLTIPLGLMPLTGLWSMAAAPDVVLNLISTKPAQHLIFSHYTAGIIPWLALGTIWSLAWMLKRWSQIAWLPKAIGAWLILTAGYAAYAYGPLPGASHDHTRFATWQNAYAAPVRTWAERIPASAAVSVTNNIGAQFAQRMTLYSFPLGVEQADYLVVLEGHATPVVTTQADVSSSIEGLRQDPHWTVLERQGDLTILKRKR